MYATDRKDNLVGKNDTITIKVKDQLIEATIYEINSKYVRCKTNNNKNIKLSRKNFTKFASILTEDVTQSDDITSSAIFKSLLENTKYDSPLTEALNVSVPIVQLQSLGLNVSPGFNIGSKNKSNSELKHKQQIHELFNKIYKLSVKYDDLSGITNVSKKYMKHMKQNLQEYRDNIHNILDHNMIMTGDLVMFEGHGKMYVNNPFFSTNEFSVTDNELDRFNEHAKSWSISKNRALQILETAKSN